VKRFGVGLTVMAFALGLLGAATASAADRYTASGAVKIDVMGEWAHPDDDTSIIGPCGVWRQRYGVKCGIIMVTRGEGGGNAVGSEYGPALGLRRENEDRVAHFRSGTVDIFNIDRVDFFYNRSAPLTQYFWGQDETLRRITRIIRMTQPEVYIGFTPTLGAGHGNHQQAGRYIWEGVNAAADPNMFPEQLTGPDALSTWQVKKIFSGGSTAGTGGTNTSPNCTTGFVPAATNLDTVVGAWTGYDSPYRWPEGNVQGEVAGSPKIWEQVHNEGAVAYPTQSRTMYKGTANPNCRRFGMTQSLVPFQPNTNPDGRANPAAGQDDAILYGATVKDAGGKDAAGNDAGGLPLGTQEYLTFSRFVNAPGAPFEATVHVKSPQGRSLPGGTATFTAPSGWNVDAAAKPVAPSNNGSDSTATFVVTPSPSAAVNTNYKLSARLDSGGKTGYTDNVVRVVAPAEGRFQRWGRWAEYDNWLEDTAPQASRLGRSPAVQSMGVGESMRVPVDVHNWSDVTQSGNVNLTLPAGMTADATSKPYGPLAPGADTTVEFTLRNSYTNSTLPTSPSPGQGGSIGQAQNTNVPVRITTTYSAPAGSASEDLTVAIVPKTAIPGSGAPALDGTEGAGEYPGEALDVGRKWEPGGNTRDCNPLGVDCGSSSTPGSATSTYAKVTRSGDDLYFFIHVRDDYQSYAVKPDECVGHWQADSVELIIDPRGNSTPANMDTATTFKLGIFPFTNDPSNSNGNGANGPCWSRDADNHQGFSTGPLASIVSDAPNAPGVRVASTARWVGDNQTSTDHSYGAEGGYNLEVKIPMANLPAAVDPNRMGLNITPYDNDNTAEGGSGTLRHIDMSTRLAWSTFGSVQSDPWLWGLATLPGYTPPAGRSSEPDRPNLSNPNLNGVDSPQTISQSAHDGVPISGRRPAPANDRITTAAATLDASSATVDLNASGPGRAHIYLWSGDPGYIPVFETSCSPASSPPPDYGLSACSAADGGIPSWAGMSGRVVADRVVPVSAGGNSVTIPLSAADRDRLAKDGRVLVSFETPNDEVQAFDVSFGERATASQPTGVGGGKPAADRRCGNEVLGTAASERLAGTALGDLMTGFDGADFMDGGAGDDCVNGLGGNDVLFGGTGVDSVEGGTGNDRVSGGPGRGTLRGGSGNDRVVGGSRADVIQGNTGRDRISGGAGTDVISGGSGRDTITPGKGRDSVEAGSGNDRVRARDGKADSIDCGRGKDVVVSRDRKDRLSGCERRARL